MPNFVLVERSGSRAEVDETNIKAIIYSDRHITTREIAEKFNVSHTSIRKKLKQLGYLCQEIRFMDPSSALGNSFYITYQTNAKKN